VWVRVEQAGARRRTCSMLNLAMLTALGRSEEWGIYTKGGLESGVTVEEIQEILLTRPSIAGRQRDVRRSWLPTRH
jgi:alkylhydroperoxidase/carboxymuconolactone decarboxylase family protein YurZ